MGRGVTVSAASHALDTPPAVALSCVNPLTAAPVTMSRPRDRPEADATASHRADTPR
jgi:hypothetical protein